MKDVFISYSRIDAEQADRVREKVAIQGYSVWFDTHTLRPGSMWEDVIPNAMQSSKVILILFSLHSKDSDGYQQKEIEYALELHSDRQSERQINIIPISLDGCAVPNKLKHLNCLSLVDSEGERKLLEYLCSTLWPSSLSSYYSSYIPKLRKDKQLILPGYGAATVMLRDTSEEIEELLGEPEEAPDVSVSTVSILNGRFFCYYKIGVEILMQFEHVAEINLYGHDDKRYYPYQGRTPEGISFKSSKKEIEKVYGRPDESWRDRYNGCISKFSKLGIIFVYKTYDMRDLNIKPFRIHIIATKDSI